MKNTKDRWMTAITIHDEVRSAVWGAIFPDARVPVTGIIPIPADLPGMPGAPCYFLDLAAISDDQRDLLVHKLTDLFSLDRETVIQDIEKTGVPILANNTTIDVDPAILQELAQALGSPGVALDPELVRTMTDPSDLEEIEAREAFELIEEADAAGLEEIDPSLAGVDPSTSRDLEIDDGGDDDN